MQCGYLLELKYIARHEFSPDKLQQKVAEAETQLHRYITDPRIAAVAKQVTIKGLVLVYNGWESEMLPLNIFLLPTE